MLAASLSTGHKIGIVVVAAIFVVFALLSSFVFPRLSPGFPGKRLGLFVGVCVLLTVGMLTTIVVLAKEPPEARAKAEQAQSAHNQATTTQASTTQAAPPAAPAGNAANGKALFAAQGCSACHTFTPAGATAKVGPDLDKVAADAQKAGRGTEAQYVTESIKDPGAYVVPGYPNGVMPKFTLTDQQVADLVAFVTSGAKS